MGSVQRHRLAPAAAAVRTALRTSCLWMSLLFVAVPAGGGAAVAEPAAFVAGVADLPLMPGLSQVPDAGVVFDKPFGRIVESYAEGAVTRAEATAFYQRTLPQLGWRPVSSLVFLREGEQLRIAVFGGDGDLILRFTLQPD